MGKIWDTASRLPRSQGEIPRGGFYTPQAVSIVSTLAQNLQAADARTARQMLYMDRPGSLEEKTDEVEALLISRLGEQRFNELLKAAVRSSTVASVSPCHAVGGHP